MNWPPRATSVLTQVLSAHREKSQIKNSQKVGGGEFDCITLAIYYLAFMTLRVLGSMQLTDQSVIPSALQMLMENLP